MWRRPCPATRPAARGAGRCDPGPGRAAPQKMFVIRGTPRPMPGVATRAGVSAQTVYSAFGNQGGAAQGAAYVGNGDPAPLAERPDPMGPLRRARPG